MSLQITYQNKATQTDLDSESTIEKIFHTMTLLCTKVDTIDKELQQIKNQQHDVKHVELSPSDDLKIPELGGDDGKHRKTQTNSLLHTATGTAKKIEKQEEIQKIEIPAFYARKRVIGLATILNELATNYLSGNTIWSYYAREQTMIYSNCRETRPADMEEIRQWVLSLLKPEQKPTTRAIRQNFISTELMANYCKTIGHKYPDHQCSKCYGEDNVIPAVNLE
ncbi:hypothetical protein H5410_032730 [Solanum commersonii]|uniref:Uncharacterized protein n=1 Tax=Solanum commersonii TaxID=4109 RepID=A0A9J5YNR8_SOLCO|nr:hypothetical protein H5410_032730 [Solanum commersonii]